MRSPLPIELLTSGRDLTEPRLAPVGRPQVAFVQRAGAYASINAVWLDEPGPERIIGFGVAPAPGRGLGGGCFTWVARGDELSIVFVGRDGGLWWQDGLTLRRLDGPDPEGTSRSCRAPAVDAAGSVIAYVLDEAEVWLVDLAAVAAGADPASARRRLDDGRHEFCFDPAIDVDGRQVCWQSWSPPDMPWDGASRVEVDLESGVLVEQRHLDAAIQQPRWSPDGRPVQVDDRSGWLNVSGPDGPIVAERVEHASPTWGMGNRSFAFDDGGTRLALARNEGGFGGLDVLDPGTGRAQRLGRGVHGHVDWRGDTIVAVRTGARTPTQIVAYDVPSGRRSILALSSVEAWPLDDLPEPELIEAVADDGATLHGRRYGSGAGRLLVWVHGGPTDQWRVDWRPRLHYWWSRGWDVLVVDPRGTTGHGRAYQQALHGGWGRRDVDDTAALVRQDHATGATGPDRTVVIGGSSGGLTVLGVLADHPDLVAGGVASYPVSDLRALAEVTHRFEAHYTDTLVAPNDGSASSEERFRSLSPLWRADRIAAPLLIVHGTDDPVVPIEQSRTLVERLRADRPDADVTLIEYEGEGHGFREPANVVDEAVRTEAFLARVVDVADPDPRR